MNVFNTFYNSPWCFFLLVPLALVLFAKKPRSFVLLTVYPQLLRGLKNRGQWRAWLHKTLSVVSLACVIVGVAQPQEISHHEQLKFKTRYVAIVRDKSGSMSEGVTADDQTYANEQSAKDAKNNAANSVQPGAALTANASSKAEVTSIAIKALLPLLKGDKVFITAFDDKIHWLGVPTTDMEELALPMHLQINPDGSTNFAGLGESVDGQPVGGIEGGILGLKALSKLEDTRILIIITDGDDDIPDKEPGKEFSTLVKHLKDENIHFYVIGVGTSWVQPNWETKLDLAKLAFEVNGKTNSHIIRIGKKEEMVAGLTSIASLEARQSEMESWDVHTNLYPFWIVAGIVLLTLSIAVKNFTHEEI
jgi:hypothetical protein